MRNRQIFNYSWKFQDSSFNKFQNRKKISKNIKDVNKAINRCNLIDIYRTLHCTKAECTFFPMYTNYLIR